MLVLLWFLLDEWICKLKEQLSPEEIVKVREWMQDNNNLNIKNKFVFFCTIFVYYGCSRTETKITIDIEWNLSQINPISLYFIKWNCKDFFSIEKV